MNKNPYRSNLAMSALDDIPPQKSNALKITGLIKKNHFVTGYKLSNGKSVTKDEAITLAKEGNIQGVGIAHKKETVYLKSLPDSGEENNLSNLPTFID